MVRKDIKKKRADIGFRCREEIVMKSRRNSTLVILIINGVNIRVAGSLLGKYN